MLRIFALLYFSKTLINVIRRDVEGFNFSVWESSRYRRNFFQEKIA